MLFEASLADTSIDSIGPDRMDPEDDVEDLFSIEAKRGPAQLEPRAES